MQSQTNNNFWIKVVVACLVVAVLFNVLGVGLAFVFGTLIGGFVDLVLFLVLDVFLAGLLFALDIFLFVLLDVFLAALLFVIDIFVTVIVVAVDIFVILLLGTIAIAGYAALAAVVIIPLALLYKYSKRQHRPDDVESK